jgi:rubrerythrin
VNSKERIAYLRGLLDFMPREEKETKIYSSIVDALDALAMELEEQAKQIEIQRESYDDLAEEIDDLHDAIYDLEESMDMDIENPTEDYDDDEAERTVTTESYISMICPSCAYSFYYKYEEGKEDDKLVCPSCGEEFTRSL